MHKNKKALWLALRAYHFNHIVETHLWDRITEKFGGTDASTKAFAEKLARKLGWTKDFALKSIDEYKKFIYLAVTADFSVTPSKIIDQVWHEHLLFTKGYRDFCNETIGYQLDHAPELIPVDSQTGTFNAQYLATLKLYKTEFSIDAPEEIWGTPKFDIEKLSEEEYKPKKKKRREDVGGSESTVYSNDDTPLFMYFDSSTNQAHGAEFGGFGGGGFGGGGADGDWSGDNSSDNSSDTSSDSSSDSSSSSSDSSSSCSSSSCSSSSCGSGGCGGGD